MIQITETQSPGFYLSFHELCHCTNTSPVYMLELIDHEIAIPAKGTAEEEWEFNITTRVLVERALRLHNDLDIDWVDIKLILNLLDEITELKIENRNLKQQLNRFLIG